MSNYDLAPLDATAIRWDGDRGVGLSGTVYVVRTILSNVIPDLLCVGPEGGGPDGWTSAVPYDKQGNADRETLLMMAGRDELIAASVGEALKDEPYLAARATVALRIKVDAFHQQIAASYAKGGQESDHDIAEMEAECHRWHLIEGKVSRWEASYEPESAPAPGMR